MTAVRMEGPTETPSKLRLLRCVEACDCSLQLSARRCRMLGPPIHPAMHPAASPRHLRPPGAPTLSSLLCPSKDSDPMSAKHSNGTQIQGCLQEPLHQGPGGRGARILQETWKKHDDVRRPLKWTTPCTIELSRICTYIYIYMSICCCKLSFGPFDVCA